MMAGGVTCRSKHRQSTISPALLQLASSYSLVLQRNMPIAETCALNQSINSHPFISGERSIVCHICCLALKNTVFVCFFCFFVWLLGCLNYLESFSGPS